MKIPTLILVNINIELLLIIIFWDVRHKYSILILVKVQRKSNFIDVHIVKETFIGLAAPWNFIYATREIKMFHFSLCAHYEQHFMGA